MGFESGSLSFTAFYLSRTIARDAVEGFARQALPPINTLARDPVYGWVTGRHLLDRRITPETAFVAGRLRLTLTRAERKIPQPLLRAECTMEELAAIEAEGAPALDRKARAEIRKQVVDRLLPDMPPTLTGVPILHTPGEEVLYAGATSDKAADSLVLGFRQACGVDLIPLTPATAALKRKHRNTDDLSPASFSAECEEESVTNSPGMDFLTWLWFFHETEGGELTRGQRTATAMIEGPLTFFQEGHGAHVAVLRNGQPLIAIEGNTALQAGKKLRGAKVGLAVGDDEWSAVVDADSFAFRSVKLPKETAIDPIGRFEERALSLERFLQVFLGFYDHFLDLRLDPERWRGTLDAMRKWVADR